MQTRFLISAIKVKENKEKMCWSICDNRTPAVSQVVNKCCCYSPHQCQYFLQVWVLQKEEVFKRVQILLLTIVNASCKCKDEYCKKKKYPNVFKLCYSPRQCLLARKSIAKRKNITIIRSVVFKVVLPKAFESTISQWSYLFWANMSGKYSAIFV